MSTTTSARLAPRTTARPFMTIRSSGTGTVSISDGNSRWINSGNLVVANSGNGTLNISAGVTGTILPQLTNYKVIPMIGLLIAIAALMVLGWRAHDVSLIEFEILLVVIGIGFGGLPPLSATVLQNSVSISTFGTAVATMQFSRNLYCTMMVAAFGAIVIAGPLEAGAAAYSTEGFARIFYAAAASFALALFAVILVEEEPLQATHA